MEKARSTVEQVLAAARRVHEALGHRLSDEAYEGALAEELAQGGLAVERGRPLVLRGDGCALDFGLVADLLVEGRVVVRLGSLAARDAGFERLLLGRLALPGARAAVFLDFSRKVLDVLALAPVEAA